MQTKVCNACQQELPLDAFSRHKTGVKGRHPTCRECRGTKRRKEYKAAASEHSARAKRRRRADPRNELIFLARRRAKVHGLPFALSAADIVIPATCPVLGIPLTVGDGRQHDASPSLDRLRGEAGYTPDNVRVISFKANRIKNNASEDDLARVLAYVRNPPSRH